MSAGWKTYTVAVIAICFGLYALRRGYWSDGVKGIVFGLALIALRDAVTKILREVAQTRSALMHLRAAVDAELTTRPGRR
jgi:thiamine transporter ThiT